MSHCSSAGGKAASPSTRVQDSGVLPGRDCHKMYNNYLTMVVVTVTANDRERKEGWKQQDNEPLCCVRAAAPPSLQSSFGSPVTLPHSTHDVTRWHASPPFSQCWGKYQHHYNLHLTPYFCSSVVTRNHFFFVPPN